MTTPKKPSLNYEMAGVNIDAGNRLVDSIKRIAKQTHRAGVMQGIGGFAALFELAQGRYEHPLLVSSTDGVGTKLKLAIEMAQYDTIGIDLVAMCVNDLLCVGAEPLFFLDYFATGHLDPVMAARVIAGIATGCTQAGAALIGGETAEMPGMYAAKDFDLAGFSVGVVEKSQLIDGQQVKNGDALIGLASSGVHSNGYSLVRKILSITNTPLNMPFENATLGAHLLCPTRIYVSAVLKLRQIYPIHAIAHITGGGLLENLPRVLPTHFQAIIETHRWERPPLFSWLQQMGQIDAQEMWRTFNCGIGMVLCVPTDVAEDCIAFLQEQGEIPIRIGYIASRLTHEPAIQFTSL